MITGSFFPPWYQEPSSRLCLGSLPMISITSGQQERAIFFYFKRNLFFQSPVLFTCLTPLGKIFSLNDNLKTKYSDTDIVLNQKHMWLDSNFLSQASLYSNQIRDLFVAVPEVMRGCPRVLTPDAVTSLYLLKIREVWFWFQWIWSRENQSGFGFRLSWVPVWRDWRGGANLVQQGKFFPFKVSSIWQETSGAWFDIR